MRHRVAELRVVGHLHADRRRHVAHAAGRVLLLLAEKRIQKSGCAHVVAQLAVLEEDVHRLPERVIENLDQLLVDERIVAAAGTAYEPWPPGSAKVIAPRRRAASRAAPHLGIAGRRTEAHHDVIRVEADIEPRARRRSRDRARAAPACRRSPDARTRPRRAARRWRTGRARRPGAGRRAGTARTSRGTLGQTYALRARRRPRRPRSGPASALDACGDVALDGHRATASSADPRQRIADQHVDDRGCRRSGSWPAPCTRAALATSPIDARRGSPPGVRPQRREGLVGVLGARPRRGTAPRWRCAADRVRAARRRRAPRRGPGSSSSLDARRRARSRAPAR